VLFKGTCLVLIGTGIVETELIMNEDCCMWGTTHIPNILSIEDGSDCFTGESCFRKLQIIAWNKVL